MSQTSSALTRRKFLGASSAVMLGGSWLSAQEAASPKSPATDPVRRPRVAAINSIYRLRSHAYHIAGRFIHGYTRNGFHHQPPFDLGPTPRHWQR